MPPILVNDGTERRAGARYKVSFHLRWGLAESGEVEGKVTNLSLGGCFVAGDTPVHKGDHVKLNIEIPGHGSVTAWGDVTFRDERKGFGVRFSAFAQGGARDLLKEVLQPGPR